MRILLAALAAALLTIAGPAAEAQTTSVSPVKTRTCAAGEFFNSLATDGTFGCNPAGGSPGGVDGQLQVNAAGSFGGITLGGDCSFASPNITCSKTGGVAFAPSATTDTTNAANIASGVLAPARGGTGVDNGAATLTLGGSASLPAAPASTQCLHMSSLGAITAAGTDCGSSGMALDAANATLPAARVNLLGTPTNTDCLIGNGSDWLATPCPGGSGSGVPAGATHAIEENAGAGSFGALGPLTDGQLLIGSTGAAAVPATLTAGTGIAITNAAGSITIAQSGGGGSGTITPQGRLTLTSGSPVMSSDVTGAAMIYYDCFAGNVVPVGATPANLTIGSCEISLGLAAGNVLSGNIYDVFAANSGGALVLCAGPAWTSTSGRGSGAGTTEIDQTNGGLWSNTNSLTHCWGGAAGTTDYGPVATHAGTYLGSFYATAAGQTSMQFAPAAAVGGTNNILGLYNAYQRKYITAKSQDSTNSWIYNTSSWRTADGSTSNRITWLDGLGQSRAVAEYSVFMTGSSGGGGFIGVNFNATSGAPDGLVAQSSGGGSGTQISQNISIALGLNFAQAMENAATTTTYFGSQSPFGTRNILMLSVGM